MEPEQNGHKSEHELVESNRATPPRRTPGRAEIGLDATRRATIGVLLVVAAATVLLVYMLANGSSTP